MWLQSVIWPLAGRNNCNGSGATRKLVIVILRTNELWLDLSPPANDPWCHGCNEGAEGESECIRVVFVWGLSSNGGAVIASLHWSGMKLVWRGIFASNTTSLIFSLISLPALPTSRCPWLFVFFCLSICLSSVCQIKKAPRNVWMALSSGVMRTVISSGCICVFQVFI